MLKKITIILAGLALYGCTNSANNNNAENHDVNNAKAGQTKKNKIAESAKGNLHFSEPQQIDGSAVVMYQLDFAEKDQPSRSDDYGSSSSGGRSDYWNIIFYNSETHQYHLLDSLHKMLIHSVNVIGEDDTNSRTEQIKSNYIFYLITTDDLNKDGQLDDDDPDYLFISDKAGNNLKQISPASYNVRNWKLINETNKVLIEAVVAKTEKDDDTEIVTFVYDLAGSAPPKKTFASDFINKTKVLYNQQWPVRK